MRRRRAAEKHMCQQDQECDIHYTIIHEYDISCRHHLGFKFKPIPLVPLSICYMVTIEMVKLSHKILFASKYCLYFSVF